MVVRRTLGPADVTAKAEALTAALAARRSQPRHAGRRAGHRARRRAAAARWRLPGRPLRRTPRYLATAPATGAAAAAVGSVQYLRVSLVPAEWEGQGLLGCRLKAVPEAESVPAARESGSFDVRAYGEGAGGSIGFTVRYQGELLGI
eukprot:scaffold44628_cov46-Phaeocystis_antarctica.AAC.1